MSRTNPYKKKRYSANRTILFYCEGFHEEIFLKHLRCLYSRNRNIAITIRRGKGGTAYGLVIYTDRTLGSFVVKITVLDNDKGKLEMQKARNEARKRGICLLEHTPCLESIFLSILHDGRSYKNKTSKWCKKEFESKNLDTKKRGETNEYVRLFPKPLLNKQKSKIPELKKLINLMEGGEK